MMHNFLPHTDADRQAMLDALGMKSQDELFSDVPQSLREGIHYNVLAERGLSEFELQTALKELAKANQAQEYISFLGGGAYPRFIPPAVNTIASRSEFYTAYTPYQPEISQGTLQVIYEFQTMISELTGLEVTNASVYDGASAVTEAAFMAVRATKRKTIVVAHTVHPDYRGVLETYVNGMGDITLKTVDLTLGQDAFAGLDPKTVACVVIQTPNYLGFIEETEPVRAFCQSSGALFIVSADPISLALLEPPGAYGADIVTGDIQPLGNNLAYGGPYGGYITTTTKYMRQLPGRLVGRAKDKNGKTCYTLTLQTREQHIRREKATSNICTNQALNVLKSTVYLALMGPQGLKEVANLSVQQAHALAKQLTQVEGVSLLFPNQPFFSEFTLQLSKPVDGVLKHLEKGGILGGIQISKAYPEYPNALLVSVTETNTPEQLDRYARFFQTALADFVSESVNGSTNGTSVKREPLTR